MGLSDYIKNTVAGTGAFTKGATPIGNGTYRSVNGDIINKMGTVLYAYDPNTGGMQNAQGHTVDEFGRRLTGGAGSSLDELLKSLGSGGSGSGPDHFFDVNPLDQAAFDAKNKQQAWQNDFDLTQFNYQKSLDERDWALALGDQELAKQKQASADYWQGKSLEVEQAMNAQDNQTSIATHQIDADAQIRSAGIRAEADRYAANTRLQEGLANAHNDEQRNQILLAHERELANIAKMEDDTKRAIAARESQIAAFGAETTRAAQMGDIALKNNQFLMDNATNPRNLFGLYFMQRGLTPDWDSMAAGNAPTQGDALRPYDPMKAYTPTVTLPQDFGIGAGAAHGQVGSAAGSTSLASNPFLNMGLAGSMSGGGSSGGGSSYTGAGGGGFTMPNFNSVSVGSAPQLPTDINKAGLQGGVPLAGLKPGLNLSTYGVGGTNTGADFTMPAYYDQGKTRQVLPTDQLTPGQQVWVDYQTTPRAFMGTDRYHFGTDGSIPPAPPQGVVSSLGLPTPGYTTSPKMLVGDSAASNPFAGGAKPELIENPTGAPLRVKNTAQTMADFGVGTMSYGNDNRMYQNPMSQADQRSQSMGFYDPQNSQRAAGAASGFDAGSYIEPGFYSNPATPPAGENRGRTNVVGHTDFPRFAMGTDQSQLYGNMGLGNLWLSSSDNSHLAGQDLPARMKMLADYGVPISPSLAAGATGQIAPTLNTSTAFQQRGGGVLPSLQTFGKMTKGEVENFRGYAEGVVGLPWADVIDYLGKPTQNLGSARQSQGFF